MGAARALTRPLRAVRARVRHRADVRAGLGLEPRADRTPIFILGAPRSGTTLLYQLLVEGLDVGWLANAHMQSPSEVSRIERRDRPRAARTPSTWSSNYGATREPWEPNEGGAFWYRFVPRSPHQLGPNSLAEGELRDLRAAVRAFAAASEAPVVFKNVFNSLRIPVLARALPEARFILIERDLTANARSILVGRERVGGSSRAWLSARPDGADRLDDAAPAVQAVWQVRRMNEVARSELARLAPDRSLRVGYDELCAAPADTLRRIHEHLQASGAEVALRPGVALPERFDQPAAAALDPAIEAALHEVVAASAGHGEDVG